MPSDTNKTAMPNSSDDMVEIVARAICAAQGGRPDKVMDDVDFWWQRYSGAALAAIQAMREPTDAMCVYVENGPTFDIIRPGREYGDGYAESDSWEPGGPAKIWRSMISAALQPSHKQGEGK